MTATLTEVVCPPCGATIGGVCLPAAGEAGWSAYDLAGEWPGKWVRAGLTSREAAERVLTAAHTCPSHRPADPDEAVEVTTELGVYRWTDRPSTMPLAYITVLPDDSGWFWQSADTDEKAGVFSTEDECVQAARNAGFRTVHRQLVMS